MRIVSLGALSFTIVWLGGAIAQAIVAPPSEALENEPSVHAVALDAQKTAGPTPSDAVPSPRTPAAETAEPTISALDPFTAVITVSDEVRAKPAQERLRGRRLLDLGQLREAVHALRAVTMVTPNDTVALELLRKAAATAGASGAVITTTIRLVDAYAGQGNMGTAGIRLDELVALDPAHEELPRLELALGRISAQVAPVSEGSIFARLRSLLGILLMLAIAFAISSKRKAVKMRIVFWGLGLQFVFAIIILRTGFGRAVFDGARVFINNILAYTDYGANFVFGSLGPGPASGPVTYTDGLTGDVKQLGFIFALHVLPTIIFFGSLMSVLYHFGVIQKVIHGIAWMMRRTMRTSGAESLSAAGNIFVGQTEAPLLIRPYLADMTMSELMAVMVGGFATVAGGVLAAYVRFGLDAGHLLAASVMSAPAALVMAKILYPETEISKTADGTTSDIEKTTANVIDAAAAGATDGLKLAFNVAAMLIAFIALIAMFNGLVGWAGGLVGLELSLERIFGWVFYPLSWCMGVDEVDLMRFGSLLGSKIAVNEFVAFMQLGEMRSVMTERSFIIATYALCGFANFSSIGIQIGGISGICPERRSDLARIGLKAMIGGAFASWTTACVAGILA